MTLYLLDTNTLSDYIKQQPSVTHRLQEAKHKQHKLYLCQPVYYELLRGMVKTNAVRQQLVLEQVIRPLLDWESVQETDWVTAAELWAFARNQGRQLSDMDLLVAAIAKRLKAVLVTSDLDFVLFADIPQENWQLPLSE